MLLSEAIPTRTAGSLPSTQTESMLTTALESDDIDTVKAHLVHAWLHYQTLELVLSQASENVETINLTKLDPDVEDDVHDDVALAAGYFATAVIDGAYQASHEIGALSGMLGLSPTEGVRIAFSELDFSKPGDTATDEAPSVD